MKTNRGICRSPGEYFTAEGATLYLDMETAVRVCETAATKGLVVYRVEGGIWRSPGFEARIDAIWDGVEPPVAQVEAARNNYLAAVIIRYENEGCDTFVVSTAPLTGYRAAT